MPFCNHAFDFRPNCTPLSAVTIINVIGVTETKIRDNTFNDFNPELVNYQFEFVPTPLASGGVGMYIRDDLRYTVLEKCSNNAFQATWVETFK